ncbi:MAG: hypothetical protein EOQ41_32660, partial [Mesorhizobium sp.]|uniref:hypothetical protein n=1 Tax=Mesorhizobium sp. TaxID=1871066 RepID=UPI000FE5AC33
MVEAVQHWLDADLARRELELFLAVARTDTANDRPWVVLNHYISTVRRAPSENLIDCLVALAREQVRRGDRQRLLHLAAYAARLDTHWSAWRQRMVTILEQEPGNIGFIKSLLSDPNAKYKRQEAARLARADAKDAAARTNNIATLTPQLALIASGAEGTFGTLAWAANHYRNAMISGKAGPLAKITTYTSEEIAAAIAEGFVQFALHADIKVNSEDLGRAEAKLGAYTQEYVVAAGLHQGLLHDRETELAEAPLIRALVGLRQDYFGGEDGVLLTGWSCQRLAKDTVAGADLLLRYWQSALDAGDDDLDGLDKLVAQGRLELVRACVQQLLHARPDLPQPALRQALAAGVPVLSDDELTSLAHAYHDRADLGGDQQELWSFVALALDPAGFRPRIPQDRIEGVLLRPNGQLAEALNERCPQPELLDRIRIEVLGKLHVADEDDWKGTNRTSA